MSSKNEISIEIPEEVVTKVTYYLQESRTLLAPYLQGLTAKQRKELFKMGDKTVATVQKVKSYMETNPEFVPSYMDTKEFNKDERVVTQLDPVVNLSMQLATDVKDTMMLAGSEALQSSLLYYGQVREANSKGVPTARAIYEDLQPRFSRRSKKKESDDDSKPKQ